MTIQIKNFAYHILRIIRFMCLWQKDKVDKTNKDNCWNMHNKRKM